MLSSFLSIRENREKIISFIRKDRPSEVYEGKMLDISDSERYKEIEKIHMSSVRSGDTSPIPFLTIQPNLEGVDISKTSKSSLYPLMIAVNEIPQNRRQDSLMVSFFFLTNGNVTFDEKMLKIPIEDPNEISEKRCSILRRLWSTTHHQSIPILHMYRCSHEAKTYWTCELLWLFLSTVFSIYRNLNKTWHILSLISNDHTRG